MGITNHEFHFRKMKRLERQRLSLAHKNKTKRYLRSQLNYINAHKPSYHDELRVRRNKIRKQIFAQYHFRDKPEEVELIGEIGLEAADSSFAKFLQLGSRIIDTNANPINLDMSFATRLWPTTITLLCSLMQWRSLAHHNRSTENFPNICSNKPQNSNLENYLIHCGFYDYVGLLKSNKGGISFHDDVVKIHREKLRSNIEERESELLSLIALKSSLSTEEQERVRCKVIPEILNNVIEHGVTCFDQGWWLIGQYHQTHKIISICIADNGIGFRWNLTTGPQEDEIESKLPNMHEYDGHFIELAFTEKVSGAGNAKTKDEGIIRKRYSKGASRGNGLKYIKQTCALCGIKLAVFSHYGYIMYDEKGTLVQRGACENRVFAGTMYHLVIPAK